MESPTIKYVIMHERPHLDEIFALYLARIYGKEKFPGIEKAELLFAGTGGEKFRDVPANAWESAGVVLLGVGGGSFDEHPGIHIKAKDDQCCATLMAKFLGVEKNAELEKILRAVSVSDRKGGRQPFDIASAVMALHHKYPDNPKYVIEIAMTILAAFHYEQIEFWTLTKEEFEKKAAIEEIAGSNGRPILMVTIESDNELINRFARAQKQAAVVIQKRSTGNVQIFMDEKLELLRRTAIVPLIRQEEQRLKGIAVETDQITLRKAGKIEGAEEWFLPQGDSQVFLNGSLSVPNLPPTKIPLERIAEIVRTCISNVVRSRR